MSTFTLPDTDVPVTLVDNISKEQLLEHPAFKNWIQRLQKNLSLQETDPNHEFHEFPYKLRDIKLQSVDRWNSRIGFIKFTATIMNAKGESLPGSVFLRGPSVGMMVILQPDDLPQGSPDEKHVVLTVQARIAAGGLRFVELPAGMVDDGTFGGVAAREIKEELGLIISEKELINMSEMTLSGTEEERKKREEKEKGKEGGKKKEDIFPKGMFPSAGGCDEFIPIFLHEKRVPRSQLQEWTGKLTGLRNDGEKITLKLVKLEDLWREGARDAKALGAWALWDGLRRSGKL